MLKLIIALAVIGVGIGGMLLTGMLFLCHVLNDGDNRSKWGNAE